MIRRDVALLLIAASISSPQAAHAGFTFVRPAPADVYPRPEHVAVADFDRDGRADVAVSSPISDKVAVFTGAPNGDLIPTSTCTFGVSLAGIAAADLNQDGAPDIAVVDPGSPGVFIALNAGDGTFLTPTLRSIGREPVAVAAADFDRENGTDLIVADRTARRVLVLMNDGQATPGFVPAGDYLVDGRPEEVVTAELDGDGMPDIVTLNAGSTDGVEIHSVGLLLFDRLVQGVPIFRPLPDVAAGDRAHNLIVADVNEDRLSDVALLSRPRDSRIGEITVLINEGDGFMFPGQSIELPCPSLSNSTKVCTPLALAAGDLNLDGHLDLLVTQSDPRATEPRDMMTVYLGRGSSGVFVPGPLFYTDPIPAALAIIDTAGFGPGDPARPDGLPDVVMISATQNTIGTYVHRQTNGSGNRVPGQRCVDDSQCTTEVCFNEVCCRAECRDDDEFCIDLPGVEGRCASLGRSLGQTCDTHGDCSWGYCTDGICCLDLACPTGQFCPAGGAECVIGKPSPTPRPVVPTPTPTPVCSCPDDSACVDGLCVAAESCPGDCNRDREVSLQELVNGAIIILTGGAQDCPALDRDGDDRVTVDELLRSVDRALKGCPRPSICVSP